MKIAVCGCSFSSKSDRKPGSHWSEILENLVDAEVINLAKSGCSNSYIRLQIDAAIRADASFVIINATFPNRLDIPSRNIPESKGNYTIFDFIRGKNKEQLMKTMTIQSLLTGADSYISKNQIDALEKYLMEIYSHSWKRQVDQWIMTSGLWQLYHQKIMFYYDPWFLEKDIITYQQVSDTMPTWFKEKHYVDFENSLFKLWLTHSITRDQDPGYHLNQAAQDTIANFYADRIRKYNLTTIG